ncbi:MAG: hypothetical protein ACKO91_18200 [Acidimicrobiales bacterium]
MNPRRSLAVATLVVVGALAGVAACGDDSSSSSSEGVATTAKPGAATTAKPASGGSSGSMAADLVANVNAVAKGDCGKAESLASLGDNLDPSKSGNVFKDFAKAMEQLGASGPAEVKADFALLGKGIAQMAKLFDNIDLSDPTKLASIMTDPAKAAEFEKAMGSMDDKAMTEASNRIEAWFAKKCPALATATTKA